MRIKRSFTALAFPLAVALVASTAHAEQAQKQTKPAGGTPMKIVSPNMATSIRDWHPESGAATTRTVPTTPTTICPCCKTITQTATTTTPAGPRGDRSDLSGKPTERAQEVPLGSIRP